MTSKRQVQKVGVAHFGDVSAAASHHSHHGVVFSRGVVVAQKLTHVGRSQLLAVLFKTSF